MLALGAVQARAQSEPPDRPVTVVSPYSAGGPSDVTTRVLATELGRVLNQPVIVVNRGDAGTMIGTQVVARARADGSTLLQTAGSYTINPAGRRTFPYDTLRDFTNFAIVLASQHAIVAYPGQSANTMRELVDQSRNRARLFTFASSGVGSAAHLAGELIQSVIGVTWEHVPYSGQNEAAGDILSGRVDFAVTNWSDARASVQAGRLKVLAIGFPPRLPEAPELPTLFEALPEMAGTPVGGWNGIAADIGIFAGDYPAPGLNVAPYRSNRLVVVMPAGHLLAEQRTVRLSDLLCHDVIGPGQGSAIDALLSNATAGMGLRPRIRVKGPEAVCSMAAARLGVGLVTAAPGPPLPARARHRGAAARRRVLRDAPPSALHRARREDDTRSPPAHRPFPAAGRGSGIELHRRRRPLAEI
jgi:tripartite-type tricarboxylate transporter receptor subunit TctC